MSDPADESSVFETRCERCLGLGRVFGELCGECDAVGYLLTELGKQMFAALDRRRTKWEAGRMPETELTPL